jgi:hypothetical protein
MVHRSCLHNDPYDEAVDLIGGTSEFVEAGGVRACQKRIAQSTCRGCTCGVTFVSALDREAIQGAGLLGGGEQQVLRGRWSGQLNEEPGMGCAFSNARFRLDLPPASQSIGGGNFHALAAKLTA